MKALLQRVKHAQVTVNDRVTGAIDQGTLVLLGVEKDDDRAKADRLLERILNYRLFNEDAGKMNLNLQQVDGGLLLVSQFTLIADMQVSLQNDGPVNFLLEV